MKLILTALPLLAFATPALAQDASTSPAAAAPAEPALCTDRPTKSYAACTVPAGKLQLESDGVNWTVNNFAGVRTDVVLYTNPTLKLGIGESTDVEVNWAPYQTVRTRIGGSHDTIEGVGDIYFRLKQRLTPSDGKTQIALEPFVKAPTAKLGIGNRKWEGGVALPVNFTLPQSFTLTFSPEVDLLEDGDGHGKHVQLIGTINLAKPIVTNLTAYGELWTAQNYDPAGTIRQYSVDGGLAYLLSPLVQLDAGANFGLNRFTPDAQVYVGLSTRF